MARPIPRAAPVMMADLTGGLGLGTCCVERKRRVVKAAGIGLVSRLGGRRRCRRGAIVSLE